MVSVKQLFAVALASTVFAADSKNGSTPVIEIDRKSVV